MDISIFLAKIFSVYLIILSGGLLYNANFFKPVIIEFCNNAAFHLVSGVLALVIGTLLVVVHNYWHANWTVIITILAWLTLLKGFLRLVFPVWSMEASKKFLESKNAYSTTITLMLFIGLYLGYQGFF